MNLPYAESVTVQTPKTKTDPYSNATVVDWTVAPTERDESCAVAPGGSTEPSGVARAAIDSTFDLIFGYDPGITHADRVGVRGLTCEVDGHPFAFRSPFTGWEPGVLVRVKVREG